MPCYPMEIDLMEFKKEEKEQRKKIILPSPSSLKPNKLLVFNFQESKVLNVALNYYG
jgi:hypothetical protein